MTAHLVTCRQRLDLEERMADHMVEGMDLDTLVSFAIDGLARFYSQLSEAELLATVRDRAPHLLEETDDAAGEAEGS